MYCFRENSNFPFSNQKIITLTTYLKSRFVSLANLMDGPCVDVSSENTEYNPTSSTSLFCKSRGIVYFVSLTVLSEFGNTFSSLPLSSFSYSKWSLLRLRKFEKKIIVLNYIKKKLYLLIQKTKYVYLSYITKYWIS